MAPGAGSGPPLSLVLYMLRWQLSTPILALATRRLGAGWRAAVVANLIGGAVFYKLDEWIFR